MATNDDRIEHIPGQLDVFEVIELIEKDGLGGQQTRKTVRKLTVAEIVKRRLENNELSGKADADKNAGGAGPQP